MDAKSERVPKIRLLNSFLMVRFIGNAKHAPPGLSLSVVSRLSIFLPSGKILKIKFPTSHVTDVAVKTVLFVNQ